MTVGLTFPLDFVLPDHRGGMFHLAEWVGRGMTVVVFFRGHWCPYCRRYLTKLQGNLGRFHELGAWLVAVSPEPPETSKRLADECGLTFPLVSDTDGKVIDQFGVRNNFTSVRTLMPHPAVFIVDSSGHLAFRSIDRNYKKRTTIRTILQFLADRFDGDAALG